MKTEGLVLWTMTAIVLSLALALGGGTMQGLLADALVHLASLPLLGLAIIALASRPVAPRARLPLVLTASIILLVVVQLIPLPPALWTQLPGRNFVVETFELAAMPLQWMPISLDPGATWRSLLGLTAPLAIFLAILCIGARGRRGLTLVLVGFAVTSVALGLVQLMQGPDSGLRFHAITNAQSSVGFFANRNHYAALLFSAVPFAAAWTMALAADHRRPARLGAVSCGLALTALLLGLAMALSRAGALLGLCALVLSVFLLDRAESRSRRRATLALGIAASIGVFLVVQHGLPGLLGRFEAAAVDDYRFDILAITLAAASDVLPTGSGFGTFPSVYLMHDRPEALLAAYVNHAHNDWAELWLEGGWLFVLAAAGFLVWFAQAAHAAWRAAPGDPPPLDRALSRAATISIGLLLLHGLVDYPLRTVSMLSVFALCCALLVPPAAPAAPRTTRFLRPRPVRARSAPPVRGGATGPGSPARVP
jgi:O-antigen ligase